MRALMCLRKCGSAELFFYFSKTENFDSALRTPHIDNIQKQRFSFKNECSRMMLLLEITIYYSISTCYTKYRYSLLIVFECLCYDIKSAV